MIVRLIVVSLLILLSGCSMGSVYNIQKPLHHTKGNFGEDMIYPKGVGYISPMIVIPQCGYTENGLSECPPEMMGED